MQLTQIAPVPTERAMILAGVDAVARGLNPSPNQRAVMLRWVHLLEADVADRISAEPPVLRVV